MRIHSWTLLAALAGCGVATASAAPKVSKQPLTLNLKADAASYSASPSVTRPMGHAPVRNFGVVSAGCIYRSGQPTRKGFEWLKSQGFRGIVCLREEHDDDAAEMAKYGFQYLYLPVPDERAPTVEQAETFLKFAANPNHWPLLVHCHGGEGRAATMAALVRYSFDGWTMNLAQREARNYRFLKFIRGKLHASQRRFLAQWAQTHAPGAMRPTLARRTADDS